MNRLNEEPPDFPEPPEKPTRPTEEGRFDWTESGSASDIKIPEPPNPLDQAHRRQDQRRELRQKPPEDRRSIEEMQHSVTRLVMEVIAELLGTEKTTLTDKGRDEFKKNLRKNTKHDIDQIFRDLGSDDTVDIIIDEWLQENQIRQRERETLRDQERQQRIVNDGDFSDDEDKDEKPEDGSAPVLA